MYVCLCGESVAPARAALGYRLCLECGEKASKLVKRCVVPLHKSNYMLVTDPSLIPGMVSKSNHTHGKE